MPRARKPKAQMKIKRPTICLDGGQLKSLAAARDVAKGIGLIEAAWGIHAVKLTLKDCFICCDVDWRALNGSPEEDDLRSIILQLKRKDAESKA